MSETLHNYQQAVLTYYHLYHLNKEDPDWLQQVKQISEVKNYFPSFLGKDGYHQTSDNVFKNRYDGEVVRVKQENSRWIFTVDGRQIKGGLIDYAIWKHAQHSDRPTIITADDIKTHVENCYDAVARHIQETSASHSLTPLPLKELEAKGYFENQWNCITGVNLKLEFMKNMGIVRDGVLDKHYLDHRSEGSTPKTSFVVRNEESINIRIATMGRVHGTPIELTLGFICPKDLKVENVDAEVKIGTIAMKSGSLQIVADVNDGKIPHPMALAMKVLPVQRRRNVKTIFEQVKDNKEGIRRTR